MCQLAHVKDEGYTGIILGIISNFMRIADLLINAFVAKHMNVISNVYGPASVAHCFVPRRRFFRNRSQFYTRARTPMNAWHAQLQVNCFRV